MIKLNKPIYVIAIIMAVFLGYVITNEIEKDKLNNDNKYYKNRSEKLDSGFHAIKGKLERSERQRLVLYSRIDSLSSRDEDNSKRIDSLIWENSKIKGRYKNKSDLELSRELEKRASY